MSRALVAASLTAACSVLLLGIATPSFCQTSLIQSALDDTSFTWRSVEAQGIRVYYQPGSFAERHRAMLLGSAIVSINEVMATFGASDYQRPFHMIYLESRDEMARIYGRGVTGLADWTGNGVFLVCNPEWRSFEKHEIAHVFTMGRWGAPAESCRWMIEGIAIFADGWCREFAVDDIAARFLAEGELVPLAEFVADYATLGEVRGGIYAASVIGFIHEGYGSEALRDLWQKGISEVGEVLGVDIEELDRSWQQYLGKRVNNDTEVDIQAIDDDGCG